MIIKSIDLIEDVWGESGDNIQVLISHDVEFIWDKGSQRAIDRRVTNNKYTDLIFAAVWSDND